MAHISLKSPRKQGLVGNIKYLFTYKFFTRSLQPFNWQMYSIIIKILSVHDHGTSWLHHSV